MHRVVLMHTYGFALQNATPLIKLEREINSMRHLALFVSFYFCYWFAFLFVYFRGRSYNKDSQKCSQNDLNVSNCNRSSPAQLSTPKKPQLRKYTYNIFFDIDNLLKHTNRLKVCYALLDHFVVWRHTERVCRSLLMWSLSSKGSIFSAISLIQWVTSFSRKLLTNWSIYKYIGGGSLSNAEQEFMCPWFPSNVRSYIAFTIFNDRGKERKFHQTRNLLLFVFSGSWLRIGNCLPSVRSWRYLSLLHVSSLQEAGVRLVDVWGVDSLLSPNPNAELQRKEDA